jgi:H+/Cl- antiporter ClcA
VSTASPAAQTTGAGYVRLVLLAAAVGIPAALLAAVFLGFVHYLQGWLWDDLPDALGYDSLPWFLVVALPVAGALLVVVARVLLPGDGGHPPLEGLSLAPTPLAYGPGVALAAVGTLAFGAVLGPEMPVVALGSIVGMAAAWFVRIGPQGTAVLSSAGSFSAISALFGGPLVAGVLLVEAGVGLGAALLPTLLPGLVGAATGYVVFVGFGDWGGLDAPGLVVPDLPAYEGTHVYDLVVAVAVGVLAALIVAAVRPLAVRIDHLGRRLGLPALLLLGGLAVGAIAVAGDALGADPRDVLFSGQASVGVVVEEDSTKIVVVLLVTKFLAYAVCLGCGFRGGAIFPAIFLGIALASLAVVWFDVSPTLAVAVGAAAGMAAQARLLVSSVLFASLLVGTQGVDTVPAAVLGTAAAWITAAALETPNGRPALRPRSR